MYPLQCKRAQTSTAFAWMVAWPTKVAFAYVVNEIPPTKHYRSTFTHMSQCQKLRRQSNQMAFTVGEGGCCGSHLYAQLKERVQKSEGEESGVDAEWTKLCATLVHVRVSYTRTHRAHHMHGSTRMTPHIRTYDTCSHDACTHITNATRSTCKDKGKGHQYSYEVSRVGRCLHIMLACSPMGVTFKKG